MTDVLELLRQADPVDDRGLRAETPPEDRLEAILSSRPPSNPRRRRSLTRVLVPAAGGRAVSVTDSGSLHQSPAWSREDRKSTRLNSSHVQPSRMPSSA